MRQRDFFEGIPIFVAVAEAGSFSAAARRFGISPSAVSQAIGGLEQRLGTTLFRRSTRSLSLTDVGEDYLRIVSPALSMLRQAAESAKGSSGRPSGPLRLTMPRVPFELVVAPILAAFRDTYPDVELEIAVEARLVDIVKDGYDAGLRYGNCLERDMVAVAVAQPSKAVLVASPGYLEKHGVPRTLVELVDHHALMCRSQGSGAIIPWRMMSDGDPVTLVPNKRTVVHDMASQITLAIEGMGILSLPFAIASQHLASGQLSQVLDDWYAPVDALYLYFPSHGKQSSTLRAFINFIKGGKRVRTFD